MAPRAPLIVAALLRPASAAAARAGEACAARAGVDGEEDAALLQLLGSRASAAQAPENTVCHISDCGCPEDETMTSFPDKTVAWECTADSASMNSDWCGATQSQCETCNGVWCQLGPPRTGSTTASPPTSTEAPSTTAAPPTSTEGDPCADAGQNAERCMGAQGAGRQYCMEEEVVKCCVEQGGSTAECCADKNPVVQAQAVCQESTEAPSTTADPPTSTQGDPCADAGQNAERCMGAQGAGRQYCMEEEVVKCCVEQGGSTAECCADKNPVVQAQAVCQES